MRHVKPWALGQSYGYLKKSGRTEKRVKRSAIWNVLFVLAFAVFIVGGILRYSPWPAGETLRHFGSFANCASARMMGLAPARRGQPGYWPWNDRDNDGIACEPYHGFPEALLGGKPQPPNFSCSLGCSQ
ncbi:excalibur calcium-binding domain-containing protein [Mesorhizobium sp.]|uniref:excalibur calcium-binding domain-containing protein n=1 Tax=Mesorhizobium sp. TaxID=1871066 RepID=UPI000FE4F28A|nr:excalibur calcium-binding domain-containing protein [Mesorhizobium sp.]RWQ20549.1 MAG: excalibur calcium-binding domain-containing protein [Mesorhizobium sp.]